MFLWKKPDSSTRIVSWSLNENSPPNCLPRSYKNPYLTVSPYYKKLLGKKKPKMLKLYRLSSATATKRAAVAAGGSARVIRRF